jgi:hypothetical protein
MNHAEEKKIAEQIAHSRMHHLALHKALPISVLCEGEEFRFENAEEMQSNLHRGDAYVDRLLEHYRQNEAYLKESDLKCICPAYQDILKKEINRGNTYRTAKPQSLRQRLLKAVEESA